MYPRDEQRLSERGKTEKEKKKGKRGVKIQTFCRGEKEQL